VSERLGGLLAPYDANNHVLNSLLAHLSTGFFGLSEFSLRLPSLLGGALYLYAARLLCRRLFGAGARSFLITALLCTNPFLLDHLSAARGYGMALAFLLLAADRLIGRRLYAAGIFCGLAIAANLTSVVPVAALAVAYLISAERRLFGFWEQFVVPAILISFVLVIGPLSKATPANFYFGAKRLTDTLASLADLSFPYALRSAVEPAVLLVLAGCVVCVLLRRQESFFPAALLASIALAIGLHGVAGTPYPLTRTALYLVPLAILSAASILRRPLTWPGAAIGVVCLLAFVLQINTQCYAEWRFDAGTRRIVNLIRARSANKPVTLRASWPLEPSLNFYRAMYRLNWTPVDRGPLDRPGDFWILMQEDREWLGKLNLQPIFHDEVSGTVCASAPPR